MDWAGKRRACGNSDSHNKFREEQAGHGFVGGGLQHALNEVEHAGVQRGDP